MDKTPPELSQITSAEEIKETHIDSQLQVFVDNAKKVLGDEDERIRRIQALTKVPLNNRNALEQDELSALLLELNKLPLNGANISRNQITQLLIHYVS